MADSPGHSTQYHRTARRWPDGYVLRSYRLGPQLADDLAAAAERLNVGPSDLVCFLLRTGLDQIAAGALGVPVRPATLQLIDCTEARE